MLRIVLSMFCLIAVGCFLIVKRKWINLIVLGCFPSAVFLIYVICVLMNYYDKRFVIQYPHDALGVMIDSWIEDAFMNIGMVLVILSPVLLVGIVCIVFGVVNQVKAKRE